MVWKNTYKKEKLKTEILGKQVKFANTDKIDFEEKEINRMDEIKKEILLKKYKKSKWV